MSFASRILLKTLQSGSILSNSRSSLLKLSARNLSAANAQSAKLKVKQDQTAEVSTKIVKPFENPDFFDVKKLVKLEELFEARAHFGHHIGMRNPWMKDYLFGTRLNIDIFNLEKTCEHFKDALNFIAHIAFRNGIILFITRNPAQVPYVEELAKECGEYAHCRQWFEGTFTNSTHRFGVTIRHPDLCIFLSTNDSFNEQHVAVTECAKMLIPTVGILDSNTDPNLISYPIPANDDSKQAFELYCRIFKETILKAKQKRKELEEQGFEIQYD